MDLPGVPDLARERSFPTPLQNSTLLPLLLISLAIQRHTPKTKSVFKDEYDYIIVGAGAGGSALAGRLSEKHCVTVLLLETGKPPPLLTEVPAFAQSFITGELDWKYETEPQKYAATRLVNKKLAVASGKAIGGSTVINDMVYLRGSSQIYDEWESQGAKGWNYESILRYYKKAEGNRDPDFIRNGYHGVCGPMTVQRSPYEYKFNIPATKAQERLGYHVVDPNGPTQIGIADFQSNIRHGQRCSVVKGYLVPAENRTNLDIVAEAFVKKIVIKRKRARSVLIDFKGHHHKVKARKEIILSAGSIRTPQLLMLSGIGPRETLRKFGIKIEADLRVGENLQDHPRAYMLFSSEGRIPSPAPQLQDPYNIIRYINSRTGVLAADLGLFSLFFPRDSSRGCFSTVRDFEVVLVENFYPLSAESLGLSKPDYNKYYGPYENITNMMCVVLNLRPKSRGYVSIRSTNPKDKPVIDPNYLQDKSDVKALVSGLKFCRKIFEQPEMRCLGFKEFSTRLPGCEPFAHNEDEYLECVATSVTQSSYHLVGTAKMGNPANETTVVDSELRVKGIAGLRVVDASVMPIIPNGYLGNPVIMIAEKAADMIGKHAGC